MANQYGFLVDSAKCTGCKTCQLACKDYRDHDVDINFRRVYEYTGGSWQAVGDTWQQDVFAYYLSIACNHCTDPACTKVCPSGAMHKDANGYVLVDGDLCIGCKSCAMACPYGAPQYDAKRGVMTKCDGCVDRVTEGLKPVCVDACPLRALDFAPIDELRDSHGTIGAVAPLPSVSYTAPNLVLVPNPHSRPVGDRSGVLGNPLEV